MAQLMQCPRFAGKNRAFPRLFQTDSRAGVLAADLRTPSRRLGRIGSPCQTAKTSWARDLAARCARSFDQFGPHLL